jgi:hypothetical protein
MADDKLDKATLITVSSSETAMKPPAESQPNEVGALEIRRETTETVFHKQVREVVRYEQPTASIPIDRLADPAIAQALLDERDYWRSISAEREQSVTDQAIQVRNLIDANHTLDKRAAVLESNLSNATRTGWLENIMFALGGVLMGAAWIGNLGLAAIGLVLLVAAMASGYLRSRNHQDGK